jgi:hypothetical protein
MFDFFFLGNYKPNDNQYQFLIKSDFKEFIGKIFAFF